MIGICKQLIGYAAASGCALAVDVCILWALVHFAGWNYLSAATFSFISGAFVAYELSIRLAFRQHKLLDRRLELFTFIAIGTLGLAVNTGVIFLMVNQFGLAYLPAKGVAAGFTFTCNFVARRQVLFVPQNSVSKV